MEEDQKYNRGSEWNRWDLHVHTPFSHTSEYAGATEEEKWEYFIKGLEALPKDIKVIGVNDYLFLKGYKRVLEYKDTGRLKNIDLILPVIEFRLKEFVGTGDEQLKKINYHVIFAEQSIIDIDTIEAQFLSCFRSSCNLDENNVGGTTWGGVVREESLIDLGKKIYDSTPEDKRGNDNYFEIGFNNISYSIDKLKECLGEIKEPNTYLKGKYIKAIGKSEWEQFRWTGSPADKKDIINNAHVVFSASPNVEQANKNIGSLNDQSVNSRLLHCSDAHTIKLIKDEGVEKFVFSNTNPKDLGHCFTWIKGNTSFETLRQVVVDYENRVLIQERNPIESKNATPEVFIDSIEYKRNENVEKLYFNKDINAVIGKRGAGKSVLLKHIAKEYCSEDRWEKDINKLGNFKINWCDNVDENKFIEYIPQNYLSTITYEDGDKFPERDKMLKELLFNNDLFKNAEKSKLETVSSIETSISVKIKELLGLNKQISDTQTQLRPLGKALEKDTAIKLKQKEIERVGHKDIKQEDIDSQTLLSGQIEKIKREISIIEQDVDIISKISESDSLDIITLDHGQFVGLSITTESLLKEHIKALSSGDVKGFLSKTLGDLKMTLKTKQDEQTRKQTALDPINRKLDDSKTITAILEEINRLNKDKDKIVELNTFIDSGQAEVLRLTKEIAEHYLSYKGNIDSIVSSLEGKFQEFTFITFDFKTGYKTDLYKQKFFDVFIDGRSGTDFSEYLTKDFEKEELETVISKIVSETTKIKATGGDKEAALVSLLKCRYDIDFSKSVKYRDKNGNSVTLIEFENMTGGQKAMALLDLIFNLSEGNYPIVIDQPENDIDVSGISNELKHLILKQKEKRQVIIATHSPNLLLLCDSENVIVAKNQNSGIEYSNGGIEHSQIQNDIVNILEGGSDALKKRMQKLNIR